ncbi:MAG TPA: tripartite tricarboxylate transporter permease [Thermoplasmata archaeon]|nr:tripartite tricarboxylate transporter permease [Thermoplasmata archaeon]
MGEVLLVLAILFAMLGVLFGALTGLIPGLHVNTLAAWLVAIHLPLGGFLVGGLGVPAEDAFVLIIAMLVGALVAHESVEIIPAVFLGAPNAETALTVFPGHRMLAKGEGYEAIVAGATGSLFGAIVALALLLPLRFVMGSPVNGYDSIRWAVPVILVAISALILYLERESRASETFLGLARAKPGKSMGLPVAEALKLDAGAEISVKGEVVSHGRGFFTLKDSTGAIVCRGEVPLRKDATVAGVLQRFPTTKGVWTARLLALGVFLLAGLLGWVVLNAQGLVNIASPPVPGAGAAASMLLPIFAGLFGVPALLQAIEGRPRIPKQRVASLKDVSSRFSVFRNAGAVLACSFSGSFLAFFPGLSAAQATTVATVMTRGGVRTPRKYLMMLSAVDVSASLFSVVALFTILRARSGVSLAVGEIIPDVERWDPIWDPPPVLLLILACFVAALSVVFFLTLYLGRLYATRLPNIRYDRLALIILVFIVCTVLAFSGLLGLVVMTAAACIGLVPILLGLNRVHLMGVLIVPVVLWYSGF